ncbi:MAG: ABC transporter substrate-binding protein [Actinomycetota bacterium]
MQFAVRGHRAIPLAAAAAILVTLTACGDGDDEASETSTSPPTTESATTTVASTTGSSTTPTTATSTVVDTSVVDTTATTAAPTTTDAPADDRTIVAVDEQTALALLSIGVAPDHVLTTLNSETFAALNADLGIPAIDFAIAEPSFEVVAGLAPDLLVGIENPSLVERADEWAQVAPLVTTPVDASWQDQLQLLATEFAAEEQAAALVAAVDAVQADVAQALADSDAAGSSVSLLTVRIGNILAINASGATGELLTAVGLTRPAAQLAEGPPGIPFAPVSPETIGDHDADLVLLGEGINFDLTPLIESPIYNQLDAVQRSADQGVVGDAWVLGGTGFATYWVLQDLVDILVDGGEPAGFDDTSSRWASFLELTS